MRGFLLDTNVLSEIRRAQCAAGVAAFAKTQPVDLLFTTEINIAEIRFGRNRAPTVERRNEIAGQQAQIEQLRFGLAGPGELHQVGEDLVDAMGLMNHRRKRLTAGRLFFATQ